MKLLLLKLPYCRHPESTAPENPRTHNSYRPMPSLALATLSAFLKTYGPTSLEIEAQDLNMWACGRHDGQYVIHQSNLRELLAHILEFTPYDVLGISSMFSYNYRWLKDAVRLSWQHSPKSRIIQGGAGIVRDHDHNIHVNATLSGEGEIALLGALQDADTTLFARTLGLDKNLEALPIPDWDALRVDGFFANGADRVLPIEASRGCPYNCSYCTVTGTWGAKVRYKSVSQLLREITALVSRYGVEKLHFVDDNLAFDRKWFVEFLERFATSGIPVQLDASNFSIKHLDSHIARLLVMCGFKRVCVAIESGSLDVQAATGKRLKLDEVPKMIRMLKNSGLQVHLCWMLEFPGETIGQIETTLDLAKQLGAESNQFLTVTPLPGTRMWQEAKDSGMLADDLSVDSLDCRGARAFKNQEWDYDWLEERIYDANIQMNFLENPLLTHDPEAFKAMLEGVLASHPGHVVAKILLGWLNTGVARNKLWVEANNDLQGEGGKVFKKHLGIKHPALDGFKKEG
jgi:anaerobic magnesium-protoporphyrin IX monomethyl ester cyclase